MAHIWMSHGTHMNESWHAYEWVMGHIWKLATWASTSIIVVLYEWAMAHTYMRHGIYTYECEPHKWMSHGTYIFECVMSHMWMLSTWADTGWRRLIGCLNLHVIFRKRATMYRALLRTMHYQNKASYGSSPPCSAIVVLKVFIYKWVMAHVWMSHDTHVNDSCHTYERVRAHMWMRHGTRMNESWHTYEWVVAHVWMRHGTFMNALWHTYERVMTHMWMSRGTHMNNQGTHMKESWHTYGWVMAHLWMSHGTSMNQSWHTYEYVMTNM